MHRVKLHIILIICVLASFSVKPQSPNQHSIDSLKKVVRQLPKDSIYAIADNLHNIAWLYHEEGRDSLFFYYHKSIDIIENNFTEQYLLDHKMYSYLKLIATNLNNLGFEYENRGNVPLSLELQLKGLKLKERFSSKGEIAVSLNNIAAIYRQQGEKEKAWNYYEKCLEYFKEDNDLFGVARTINTMAFIYLENNDTVKALDYLYQAVTIRKRLVEENPLESKFKTGLGRSYNSLGNIYIQLSNYDSSLIYLNNAEQIFEEENAHRELISTHSLKAKLYFNVSDYKKAEEYALLTNQEASEMGQLSYISSSNLLLSQINEKLGNNKQAYLYYKDYILMHDSLQNEDNKKATYKQQMKYEYEKKEEELRTQEEKRRLEAQQDQKVRNTIIYAVSLGLGLSIFFLFFLYSRFILIRKQKYLIEQQSENLHKAYHELHELQQFKDGMTGMIVHDLKNPLNAMLGYAEEVQSVNLKTRIRNTSRMMLNYVLNMLDVQKFESQKVPLAQHQQPFSEVLHQAIEQVTFLAQEKNITITNKIKRNYIVNLDEELIGRVIVNLLTNAIKYSPLKSTITIDAGATTDKQLKVMIADQGQGIPKDMLDKVFDKFTQVEAKRSGKIKSTGLGLTFCKLVVEGHQGQIWVESEEGKGSQFYFTLPLINDAGEILGSTYTIANNENELSPEDLAFLASYKSKLSDHDVMDFIEIIELLEEVRSNNNSISINNWANKIENACLGMDEELYKELLK